MGGVPLVDLYSIRHGGGLASPETLKDGENPASRGENIKKGPRIGGR